MTYFRESRLGVHLAVSGDLKSWRDLNGGIPVIEFAPERGKIVRDPYIIQDREKAFHLFFTDNWRSQTIGYCKSRDLKIWTQPEFLPVAEGLPPVQNCWAPECVYDREGDRFLLFWSSRLVAEEQRGDKIYYRETKDFVTYGDAKVLFDPGYPVIDSSICYFEGRYYMCFKDERGLNKPETDFKALRTCVSERADGPYQNISGLLTHSLCEGPAIVRKNGKFIVFFDAFGRKYYGAMESADFSDFADVTSEYSFPPSCKHCSIIEIDNADYF